MKIKFSQKFECHYGNIDWEPVTIGESGAQVYRNDTFVLKIQRITKRQSLLQEKSRIEWLKGKISVPDIIDYQVDETFEYLLMSRLHGIDAAQTKWKNDPIRLVHQLGSALRQFHDKIDIKNCPFDEGINQKLKECLGREDANDQLIAELLANAPQEEELVFTHGDYCLPNIIIDEEQCCVVGFVDLGRAGMADRYNDIALALRSIQYNLGNDYSHIFLEGYGLFSSWDEKKIDFYQKLDQLL
ncbi:unnamed protein product [Rotaria sp. Silwood1]|nr:unnamed protein product [Rotaria sp. Silwood1]CAF1273480.1 unnamed protein product [Rotaria sp. Silwood1]CAF1609550.1 unnamed protein product [Rotaria sp. Silwood1]CAF1612028.1 unnamed protein product [Rotaria sp. Silwood1]CAF3774848.1 unnamed protein product [Rotaria sp. Silwood1]